MSATSVTVTFSILTNMKSTQFNSFLSTWQKKHARMLPWRPPELPEKNGVLDPYKILVSELMLQQTQVSRVIPKYRTFMNQFPTLHSLANAPQAKVLAAWQGLGYNRRALYLHSLAHSEELNAKRWTPELLQAQKGIGKNTAAAICVYAFNEPHIFIETNIRSVFLHHFFENQSDVSDAQILPVIEAHVPKIEPRLWYWSLMDYGSKLKKQQANPSRRSKHHTLQPSFEGSKRQLRGQVLKLLLQKEHSKAQLKKLLPDERLASVLSDLQKEGFIEVRGSVYVTR